MEHMLEVNNLEVKLGGMKVIEDLSFTLERGSSMVVLGPNGSGKTVLLRCLLGMLPYSGEIKWAPKVRIGYVPQKVDVDRRLPLNVENLLRAKADVLGLGQAEVDDAAETAGLQKEILARPIGNLSGGQLQRALIAFALLGRPEVILLDEPTASLDQQSEDYIYELMHKLQKERQTTTVLVSHDLSIVYHYADTVLCLNRQAVCFGPPEEVLTPDVLKKLYRGEPKYHQHSH